MLGTDGLLRWFWWGGGGGKTLKYAFLGGGLIFYTITHRSAEFSLHFKPLKGLNFQDFFPGEHAPGPP